MNPPYGRSIGEWIKKAYQSSLAGATAVNQTMQDDIEERKQRLRNRISPFPNTYETITRVFQRNPDVIAEVLIRAKGICEKCGKDAPFKRSSDGTPYLEVHHIKRLADGGEDTVENAIAYVRIVIKNYILVEFWYPTGLFL